MRAEAARWRNAAGGLGTLVASLTILAAALPASSLGADGSLGFIDSQVDGVGPITGLNNPSGVVVSPDGRNVYVASCADYDVAEFSRAAPTGRLTFLGTADASGLGCVEDIGISPDGATVYAVADGGIAILARDAGSGKLTPAGSLTDAGSAYAIAVSRDGRQAYVADIADLTGPGRVLTYNRDPSGALSLAGAQGVAQGATSVAISPDGSSVYASFGDSSLAVYGRNTTTGALTPAGTLQDGVGGVDGLGVPNAALVEAGGGQLYVAAGGDAAVSTFTRNTGTGALTYSSLAATGSLSGANSLSESADGANVYAAAYFGRSVVTLARNPSTGGVSFVSANSRDDRGDDGFKGVWRATISPDGKNVYTANLNGDSVSTFARNAPPFTPTIQAKKKQKASALAAALTCSFGCDYRSKAKVKVGKKKFKSRSGGTLPGLQRTPVTFKFSARQLKGIAKALKKASGTATLTVHAFAGKDEKTATAIVKLKK